MNEECIIAVSSETKIEPLIKEIINCPSNQIILEVAPDSTLLSNEINLRLIKFYAEEESKNVIINAKDPVLISLAQRLGLSTIRERVVGDGFSDGNDLEGMSEETDIDEVSDDYARPVTRRVIRYHGGLFPALLVTFFTFILAIWWLLQPKATVIVYPKEQFLTFRSQVSTSLDYDDRGIAEGKIPAKLVEKSATLEVQNSTTGQKVIGVTPAVGRVTVINSTGQPLMLPKGTSFTSRNGIRFISDQNIMVPKKRTKFQYGIAIGEEYGRAEVPITAEMKGTSGNVPAKSITKIDGRFSRYVTVVNLLPTSKGTDQQVAVVTLDDVKKGEAEAREQMLIAGPDEAASLVTKDYLFLPELTQLELIRIGSFPDIGEAADVLRTRLEYKVSVLAPSRAAIRKYLSYQLNENMPSNFEAKNNEVSLISANAVSARNIVKLELLARGKIRGVLNQDKIKRLITGKTLAEAKRRLTGLNEVADYQIELQNKGKTLPAFGFQIRILFPAGAKEKIRP